MSDFIKDQTVYDLNGNAARFVSHIKSVGFVVLPYYEGGDEENGQYFEDSPAVWSKAFSEAPTQTRDEKLAKLDNCIAEKQKELYAIQDKIRAETSEYKNLLDTLKSIDYLRNIDRFINGEITHYVDIENFEIFPISKTICEDDREKRFKLLSLSPSFNNSWDKKDATISWSLSRYWDGSGGKNQVIPCLSEEEAIKVLGEKITEWFLVKENANTYKADSVIRTAKKYGFPYPLNIELKLKVTTRSELEKAVHQANEYLIQKENKLNEFLAENQVNEA